MQRKAVDADTMTLQLQAKPQTRLQYPQVSAAIKTDSLVKDISRQRAILDAVYQRGAVDLRNLDEVKLQSDAYMQACERSQCPPVFEQLCSALGKSRQTVYAFIGRNPTHPTAVYLNAVRQAFTSIIASQALQRNFSEAVSIFIMKNSDMGFSDSPQTYGNTLGEEVQSELSAQQIAQKYKDLPD